MLLIHEGLRQSAGDEEPDPNGCSSPSGGLEAVVKRLSEDIAVVISGHTHAFYNCRIGTHLVTSAGSYGRILTRVMLDVDAGSGRIVSATANNQIVTRDVSRAPVLSKIVGKYATLVERTAAEVVGSVTGTLSAIANAAGEAPLGDLIADAQLAMTRGDAVVAFMNPGGIRADIVARPQASASWPGP